MKRLKYIMMILFASALLLIPNISNAASTQTYQDNEQNIEWSYELDNSDNVINLKCNTTEKIGKVEIPSEIESKPVISLSGGSYHNNGAFQNCAGITEVTIPGTITTIGSYAFSSCTGLKSIVLPDSVTTIGSYAFQSCSGLKSITFSEHLSSIGSYAFSSCTGLQNVKIPNSVTLLDDNAFYNCSGLKELTLSNSLSKISNNTFYGCTGLTSVILPDSVTTIVGNGGFGGAFYRCTNLQKILIPDTVASIGSSAFEGCPKLTIYGHDNMTSKEYAEAHQINFDYIENWDKATSGNDITSPTVENILVTYESVMHYNKDTNQNMYIVPSGTTLAINVVFSEAIKGTEIPTLTIKFGNGQNIQITEGTIGSSTITYTYIVKSTDEGVMATVDYSGGNITDDAGNVATLSCPNLKVQYSTGDFVYANGSIINSNTDGNITNGGTTSSGTNNSDSNTVYQNNGSTTNGNDKTTATGKLPQTGIGTGLATSLIITICITIFLYLKNRKYKDI